MEYVYAILIGILWSQILSHFCASILLHRYYCHKQFNVPVWFEVLGLFGLMLFVIRSPIGWIASHRMHHADSDGPKDPHAVAYVGYWKVLLTTWDIPRIPTRYARDLYKNPRLVFCHNHWGKIWFITWIISFLINPAFFIGFCVIPFIFAKIGFGLLNTTGHSDGPMNKAWLNFFIAGEGFHKEHHRNAKRLRLHKWDTGGWLAEQMIRLNIFKV